MFRNRLLPMLVFLAMFSGQDIFAHRLRIFAAPEGKHIRGSVYFSGGGKGKNIAVNVSYNGVKLTEVTTDKSGEFSFTPKTDGKYTFIVDSGGGHSARTEVTFGNITVVKKSKSPSPVKHTAKIKNTGELRKIVAEEVSKGLFPLREQLNSYEDRVRFRDILGGIGYIIGIAGLYAWLKSRKK